MRDLVGSRTQTNYHLLGSNVLEETYEIRLRNRKDSGSVEIRVPEHLFRWSNWEILDTSHEFTKTNSNTIEFRVEVPPQGETVITYAAPHHLNADGGLLSLRRSRGGDAWQSRQARPEETPARPVVGLGMPARASG